MPTTWENSCVDQLEFNSYNADVQKVTNAVRESVESMILPDGAKMLVAVATDIVTAIQTRNDRPDVRAAVASLHACLAVLQAIDGNLDG
jgi:hypothetical protein